MSESGLGPSARRAGWTALVVLTSLNILNYIDRNIFSALVPAIKQDLGFSDTQLGLLGSAFIFSYTLISPLFGFMGDRGGRSKIMGAGVLVWSGATVFSGLTTSYIGQFLTRITVGFGEAAYSVIAPSVIADHFPKIKRGAVFAIYSCAIPVGSALGYVIGGILEPRIGWQHAFFVVGVPGFLLAVVLFFMRDPQRGQSEELVETALPREDRELEAKAQAQARSKMSLKQVYSCLLSNGGFMTTVLGYAGYTFVLGGLAFWMPSYIVRYFDGVSVEKANLVFGGVTVVGGFVGTILGGWWADRIERKTGSGYLKVAFYSMLLSIPLFIYCLGIKDFTTFALVLFVLEVALFLCISPLDAAVINYVRPGLRSTAMALDIFIIHALGDGISRVLLGAISDASDLRTAMFILPWALVVAAVFWGLGVVLFWQPVPWAKSALKLPVFQAHRGLRPDATVIENSLAAFRLAREAGAEMTECDVHISKDGVPVVFHDFDLKRMVGSDDKIADLTAQEITRRTGAPTLAELLADSNTPRLINIELKTPEIINRTRFEEAVVRVVREARAESRVMFSSFNPFAIRRLSKLAPEIPRGLLVTDRPGKLNKIYFRKMWLAFWARPHLLHLDESMITPERVERWRERGIQVVVWTVNDRARASELLAMGVRGIISDRIFS